MPKKPHALWILPVLIVLSAFWGCGDKKNTQKEDSKTRKTEWLSIMGGSIRRQFLAVCGWH